MHSKNGRVNSDFQLTYFIAGACSTYDGAYAALREQELNRKTALAFAQASMKQAQAKLLLARIAVWLFAWLPPARLWCEGYLEIFASNAETRELIFQAAVDELATIQRLIARVQPLRQFKHLPDREAFQACERDEWAGELMRRAENQLATRGFIAPEDFAAMRNHPDFETKIGPKILAIKSARGTELAGGPVSQYLLRFEEPT